MVQQPLLYIITVGFFISIAGCPSPTKQSPPPPATQQNASTDLPPQPPTHPPQPSQPAQPQLTQPQPSQQTHPTCPQPQQPPTPEPNEPAHEPQPPQPPSDQPTAAQPPEPNTPTTAQPTPEQTEPNQPAPPSVPGPNQPTQTTPEPNQPTLPPAEPNTAPTTPPEPNVPEPNQPAVSTTPPEPNTTTLTPAEPNIPQPDTTEPNLAEPNILEPNLPRPTTPEPNLPPSTSARTFHDKCAEILRNYVNDDGTVDYKNLRRHRLKLIRLLRDFDNLDPNEYNSWSQADKIAFWINVYNIKMLDIITENYPIKPISRFHTVIWGPNSIRHIEGIWSRRKFMVMDEEFTLGEIEKRFFRKQFADPRILLALTRASLSSPPLRKEPYYGYKLDQQLDDQARKFLASPYAFKIDRQKGRVYLSALFQKTMYGTEFLKKYAIDRKFKDQQPTTRAVLNFISRYIRPEDASYLETGNYTVQFMRYDWTINDGSK